MRIFFLTGVLLISFNFCGFSTDSLNVYENDSIAMELYRKLDTQELNFNIFKHAFFGYKKMQEENLLEKNILTVIDFSVSSSEKRLWTIDMDNAVVLFNELVAHGRNSGNKFARNFSNEPNSYMSSLGFYVTDNTYHGKHGLSLKLDGIEPGINDKARERYIVIHGADYVSNGFITRYGRLGRSYGCPALPVKSSEEIINAISDSSCVFIYGDDPDYFVNTRYQYPEVDEIKPVVAESEKI